MMKLDSRDFLLFECWAGVTTLLIRLRLFLLRENKVPPLFPLLGLCTVSRKHTTYSLSLFQGTYFNFSVGEKSKLGAEEAFAS
jgi:hypothetical protein